MYVKSKRGLDFLVALSLLILFFPIIVIAAVAIRVVLGSPVVYSSMRPGLHGVPFRILKFRSMTDAKDENGELLPDELRTTAFGQFLRSTSIDELPELLNVVKGDMSLVGPRPLLMEYLPLYNSDQSRRHDVRPGITGYAQVNGRNNLSWAEKFRLDCHYVDNISLGLDLKILWKTILVVVLRQGITDEQQSVGMDRFTGNKS
jgi:sugar transferase EpsL